MRPIPVSLISFLGLMTIASCLLGNEISIERNVVYGKEGDVKLLADIYSPSEKSGTARPVVLLVHGGGWEWGNKTLPTEVAIARRLVEHGYVAISIDYRLVKQDGDGKLINQWPAAIDDCRQAVRWIRENAQKLNVDPVRIGAAGDSAGGHLVSLLGTTDTAQPGEPSTRVQAVVDIYGPADLRDDSGEGNIGDNPNVRRMVDNFLGEGPTQAKSDASPILHIDDKTASFLILQGDQDALVSYHQSANFHKALQKSGRMTKLVLYENEGHGFSGPTMKRSLDEMVTFFDQQLKQTPTKAEK